MYYCLLRSKPQDLITDLCNGWPASCACVSRQVTHDAGHDMIENSTST